ncbi:sigma-70 family RNA polymerase sigma factor [Massilibacteroides sp.]|uniref:RNA polymerase sigma factor n=1 Tax=Massilibacteroides sp. TaxID=2034766 RepID=UPI002624C654|nr:sigma-70 family RNA polymerase sigma factor [Massilibacteroides sp.]MDD4515104.1 sigma-70 family RNA polymerase sigma factor [Massilibacteroides sp.]
MNEEQLIESCKRGDRIGQKELYNRFSRKMMGVCYRYVNDKETAADLLQEGFIKVFMSLKSYSGTGSFEGWVRKIFVNSALEYLRKTDVLREATDLDHMVELSQPDSSVISSMTADELMKLVQELPPGFRTVFNLFAIEGYSHREIGELLNITESTSRSQYTRARQLLQKKINALH